MMCYRLQLGAFLGYPLLWKRMWISEIMAKTAILAAFIEIETSGTNAQSIIDSYQRNPGDFRIIVVHSRQKPISGAVAARICGIERQTVGPLGLINVATNTFAGAATFLKIVVDFENNEEMQAGDIISVVGNETGVVCTFAIMATGEREGQDDHTVAALGASATGVRGLSWEAVSNGIWNRIAKPVWRKYFLDQFSASYPRSLLAPDLSMRTYAEIQSNCNGEVTAVGVNFDTGDVRVFPQPISSYIEASGGYTSGGRVYILFPPDWVGDTPPHGAVEIGDLASIQGGFYEFHATGAKIYHRLDY